MFFMQRLFNTIPPNKMMATYLLPTLLFGFVAHAQLQKCNPRAAAHMAATLNQNASGHWTMVLSVEREVNTANNPPLHLDVRPTLSLCGSIRTQGLFVTMSGKLPALRPDYEELQGFGHYKVHVELATWDEANAACQAEGAHLLVVNSEAESIAVREFIKKYPTTSTWPHIGFSDKTKQGNFLTVFGETLSSAGFVRWHPGEPTNYNLETCGAISKATVGLADIRCEIKESFICEQ